MAKNVEIPSEDILRGFIMDNAADAIAKLQEKTGELIEQACLRCKGDYRTLFRYARAILSAYMMELTYTRVG